MNVMEQLDAGIRFFDIRIMMEYTDSHTPWYSLHMVQSNDLVTVYFKQIRDWLNMHPNEILILFLSKHGNQCNTGEEQYPNVSIEQKQTFWAEIMDIFDGLLVDYSVTQLNQTSIEKMLERNHRVVFYAADYVEFTNSSKYAIDQCSGVDNGKGNPGVFNLEEAIPWQRDMYANASTRRLEAKKANKFYKVSLATGGTITQMITSFLLDFIPPNDTHDLEALKHLCINDFNNPMMTWCPNTLLDIAQLESYYTQVAMDEILTNHWSLPHGIYLNGVDRDGTIRTGTQVFWGGIRNPDDSTHWNTAYAYVGAFIAVNIQTACDNTITMTNVSECDRLATLISHHRAKYPLTKWDDDYGRSSIV